MSYGSGGLAMRGSRRSHAVSPPVLRSHASSGSPPVLRSHASSGSPPVFPIPGAEWISGADAMLLRVAVKTATKQFVDVWVQPEARLSNSLVRSPHTRTRTRTPPSQSVNIVLIIISQYMC